MKFKNSMDLEITHINVKFIQNHRLFCVTNLRDNCNYSQITKIDRKMYCSTLEKSLSLNNINLIINVQRTR